MDRKTFFKTIGIGLATALVAPKLITNAYEQPGDHTGKTPKGNMVFNSIYTTRSVISPEIYHALVERYGNGVGLLEFLSFTTNG